MRLLINKTIIHLSIIISLVLYLLQCTSTKKEIKTAQNQNVDFLIEQGKLYWEQRSDSSSIIKADHFLSLANNRRPEDFELSVLYSRVMYFRALFIEKDITLRDSLFSRGANVAKHSVISHKEFQSIYETAQGDSSFRLLSALANTPRALVPGLFWWATNQVWYLNSKPAMERLNSREILEVIMHRIISLEPDYFYGGPYRFFGLFYTRIPGVELIQSKTYFEQALANHPEYMGNAVQMSEFYNQKAGNRDQFHTQLKFVISKNPTTDPEILPENLFYQDRARSLLEQESILFE